MHVPSILILKSDRLHADLLRHTVVAIFPQALCSVVSHVSQARTELESSSYDLFLTGVDPLEGDVLDFLVRQTRTVPGARFTFVITNRREPRVLSVLCALPISGVFDSSAEDSTSLGDALQRVCAGKPYWSNTILERVARDRFSPHSVAAQPKGPGRNMQR